MRWTQRELDYSRSGTTQICVRERQPDSGQRGRERDRESARRYGRKSIVTSLLQLHSLSLSHTHTHTLSLSLSLSLSHTP
eukprot:COSAG03_NODE_792_length_5834_cov_22.439058_2_plen_80_part_00